MVSKVPGKTDGFEMARVAGATMTGALDLCTYFGGFVRAEGEEGLLLMLMKTMPFIGVLVQNHLQTWMWTMRECHSQICDHNGEELYGVHW